MMKVVRIATYVLLAACALWALGGALVFMAYPRLGTPSSRLRDAVIDFGPVVVATGLWALTRRRNSN